MVGVSQRQLSEVVSLQREQVLVRDQEERGLACFLEAALDQGLMSPPQLSVLVVGEDCLSAVLWYPCDTDQAVASLPPLPRLALAVLYA